MNTNLACRSGKYPTGGGAPMSNDRSILALMAARQECSVSQTIRVLVVPRPIRGLLAANCVSGKWAEFQMLAEAVCRVEPWQHGGLNE